jgi:hypothetical protein
MSNMWKKILQAKILLPKMWKEEYG